MTEEQSVEIEKTLRFLDSVKHPLHELRFINIEKKTAGLAPPPTTEEKYKYIPPWYRGEEAAFRNARVAMQGVSSLPKMAP